MTGFMLNGGFTQNTQEAFLKKNKLLIILNAQQGKKKNTCLLQAAQKYKRYFVFFQAQNKTVKLLEGKKKYVKRTG